MATRIIYKGRYIPDDVPTVHETYLGDGVTQLTTVEPPKKEIECFQWEWAKPPKKSKQWVYNTIAIAAIAGSVAVLMIPIFPIESLLVILGSLLWLGFVGYANAKEE